MFDVNKADSQMRAIKNELLQHAGGYPSNDPKAWREKYDNLQGDYIRLKTARDWHVDDALSLRR